MEQYLRDGRLVRIVDRAAAHKVAERYELTRRELLAIDAENVWPNRDVRARAIANRVR